MSISRVLRRVCLATAAMAIGVAALATGAAAESAGRDRTVISSGPSAATGGGGDWSFWGGGWGSAGSIETISFGSKARAGQIIVSFGDRRLYLIIGQGQALSYPIAVPREQSRWSGSTFVSMKKVNPPWTPTPTMRKENPKLPAFVPGGHPLNPLGVRAMYLGTSAYRIHGTDAPWTIGTAVSKGCIRMYNEHVIDLYGRVKVGTPVLVTWKRYTS